MPAIFLDVFSRCNGFSKANLGIVAGAQRIDPSRSPSRLGVPVDLAAPGFKSISPAGRSSFSRPQFKPRASGRNVVVLGREAARSALIRLDSDRRRPPVEIPSFVPFDGRQGRGGRRRVDGTRRQDPRN